MEGMMNLITTFHTNDGRGRAEVWSNHTQTLVKYYDDSGHLFHEETINGSISQAEQIAEDWTLGYHVLFG